MIDRKELRIFCSLFRPFVILMIALLSSSVSIAKETDHRVQGQVVDNLTGMGLDSVTVILMTADSVPLDTALVLPKEAGPFVGQYAFSIRKVGRYIVKAMRNGYDDGYVTFRLRSNREGAILHNDIRLSKTLHVLPEVLVKATKVKMVMNGDTIVYNADAFNLAEGSMLDALVAKLPGVTLSKNGQISVDGHPVKELLVNGRDFLDGNPLTLLRNLPAYTVNKIKVYNKAGAASRLMNKDMGDKATVMDVRLKREYATMYLFNNEAGVGSDKRYLGRMFEVKHSDKGEFGLIANANNLNREDLDMSNDNWDPMKHAEGRMDTKTAELVYNQYLNNPNSYIGGQASVTHNNFDNETRTTSQTFLPSGDSFSQSRSQDRSKSTGWNMNGHWVSEQKNYRINSNLGLSYDNGFGNSWQQQRVSDLTRTLNEDRYNSSSHSRSLNVDFSHEGYIRVVADMVRWSVGLQHSHNRSRMFDLRDLRYADGTTPGYLRNNYLNQQTNHLQLSAYTGYTYGLQKGYIALDYNFRYAKDTKDNPLYILDWPVNGDSTRYNLLPSTADALSQMMDKGNSYHYTQHKREHQVGLIFFRTLMPGSDLKLSLPLRWLNQNLTYFRRQLSNVSRSHLLFEPSVFFLQQRSWWIEALASMSSRLPDMTLMANYTDDANPLRVISGNPDLKLIHQYDVKASVSHHFAHQTVLSMGAGYHQTDNEVAYGLTFDPQTGVSYLKPVSVNGNWNADASVGLVFPLDKAGKLSVDNQLSGNYRHSVDMATTSESQSSMRSIVDNWHATDNLKLTFRPNDSYELTLHGSGTYSYIHGRREGFDDIHAGDYNAGVNATVSLPWHFQLTTDMMMFARRGYQQHEMNTTDWVWNAQLTRSFAKGHLLAKLQGFDILHELSTTSYAVDAQGRTETWHNSIPRYVMLSLTWRFNYNPKKIQTGFYE